MSDVKKKILSKKNKKQKKTQNEKGKSLNNPVWLHAHEHAFFNWDNLIYWSKTLVHVGSSYENKLLVISFFHLYITASVKEDFWNAVTDTKINMYHFV